MKQKNLFRLALVGVAGMALAGCGGGGGSSSTTTMTPTPAPLSLQQMFGTAFATDYAANANSTPVVPAAGDIIALSLTTQPIALH